MEIVCAPRMLATINNIDVQFNFWCLYTVSMGHMIIDHWWPGGLISLHSAQAQPTLRRSTTTREFRIGLNQANTWRILQNLARLMRHTCIFEIRFSSPPRHHCILWPPGSTAHEENLQKKKNRMVNGYCYKAEANDRIINFYCAINTQWCGFSQFANQSQSVTKKNDSTACVTSRLHR